MSLATAIAIAICLALSPGRLQAQASRACQPYDSTASILRQFGVSLVSDTTGRVVALRRKYGLPAGTPADVARVAEDSVCEAATAAIEAMGAPHQNETFVVVRLGSTNPIYLMAKRADLAPLSGIYVLDSRFRLIMIFN